jgi:uncharacterized RDD family membrane protein YckC
MTPADGGNWYILRGGQWVGPMDRAHLQRMGESGQLGPNDLVSQAGMAAGVRASEAGFVPAKAVPSRMSWPTADLASRGRRLGAAILDVLVNLVFMTPGFVLIIAGSLSATDSRDVLLLLATLAFFLGGVGCFIMQCVMLTRSGQTVGKRLLKIRIVREEDDELPGFGRAVGLRLILNGVFAAWPPYSIADILFIFGERRQCLHDRIARTRVVDA